MFLSILSGTVFVPQYLKTAQAVLVHLPPMSFKAEMFDLGLG